jgi:hypothetical protein
MSRSALFRDTQSSVSLLVAAAAIPLVGLVALAVDYGFWNQTKSQFELAADTAALNATKIAANGILGMVPRDPNWHTEAEQAARVWFVSALGKQNNFNFARNLDLHVNVVRNGTSVTTTVYYSAIVPSPTGAFLGISQFQLAGQSANTISLGGYTNITLLLDNSSSMLIGATQHDIDVMQKYTPCSVEGPNEGQPLANDWNGPAPPACTNGAVAQAPCAFACHNDTDHTPPGQTPNYADYDYYFLARHPDKRPHGTPHDTTLLRFDVVQNATQQVIDLLQDSRLVRDQFSLGVYEFNSALTTVFPDPNKTQLPTDLAAGLKAVQAIQPPIVRNSGDTDFPSAMSTLSGLLTAGGDGSSPQKPLKNLFIVTDGIQDFGAAPRTIGPITVADCNAIKALNINIYVLYTTYTPLPHNPYYNTHIAQYLPPDSHATELALQACASSPANFAEASSPQQIVQALLAMVAASIRTPARFSI